MQSNTDLNLDDVFLDAEEALKAIPSDEKLASLSKLAHEQHAIEQDIAQIEANLADKKKLYNEISEIKLPEVMDELGIDQFNLANGIKVKVSPFYSGKITDTKAYTWLEENNEADIIKGEVVIPFPKGFDKQKLRMIVKVAEELGLSANVGEQVHPSTLRAWIKDMIQSGQQFPRELFNVYVGKRAKLSLK